MFQESANPLLRKHKCPKHLPSSQTLAEKLPNIRIRDEIGYLYAKKQQVTLQLYHLHLSLANTYDSWWPHLQHTIEEKLRNTLVTSTRP